MSLSLLLANLKQKRSLETQQPAASKQSQETLAQTISDIQYPTPITKERVLAAAKIFLIHKNLNYTKWRVLADWMGGLDHVWLKDEVMSHELGIAMLAYHKDWQTVAWKAYFIRQHMSLEIQKDCAKWIQDLNNSVTPHS